MAKRTVKKRKRRHSTAIPVKTLFFTLAAFILIYFLFFAGSHNLVRYLRQRSQKETLRRDIDSLTVQKSRLKSEAKRLQNDLDYIEKIAREKYNMKKKDEKVYKIVKEK